MGSKYVITPNCNFLSEDELYHWGTKGMRWGIRRYQNPDGSLTAAGRKRYANPDGSLNEKGKKKFGDSANTNHTIKKSVKDMTDEELDRAIVRARKEDEYNRLRPESTPETGGRNSRKLMSKLIDEAIVPAAINSGKKALENALNKMADKYLKDKIDPNSYEALKKQYDLLKIKQDIENIKNPKTSWDDKLKKQTYDRNQKKYDEEDAAKLAKQQAERDAEEAKNRRHRQQNRNIMDRASSNKDKSNSFKDKVASMHDEFGFDDPVTSLSTRTVSKGKSYTKNVWDNDDDLVHIVDDDVKVDTGRRTVAGYLPPPKDDDD